MLNNPASYVKKGHENMVYKFNKALFGLKQAPRAWYTHIDAYFIKHGFLRSPHEHTLYVKTNWQGDLLMMCLYVDDLIFTGNNQKMIEEFRETIIDQFEMIDLELMCYFLGIEVI